MSYQDTERHGERLKCIFTEGSQFEKATYLIIPTIWHSWKSKTGESVQRSVVASDLEGGGDK